MSNDIPNLPPSSVAHLPPHTAPDPDVPVQVQQKASSQVDQPTAARTATLQSSPPIVGSYMLQLYDVRMKYISDRLGDTMNSMQLNDDKQQRLVKVQQALSASASGTDNDQSILDALDAAEAGLATNDPMYIALEQVRKSKDMTNGDDAKLSDVEVKGLSTMVSDIQKNIDTDAQRDGMVINDLMGQKQEIATLFAGIMQTEHASNMASINNIGR